MPWYGWAAEFAMAQAVVTVLLAGLYFGTPVGTWVAKRAFRGREG